MTTKVLITGIAGFIGSHVVERLSRRKFDIFGIDDLSSGSLENLRPFENKVDEIVTATIVDPMAVFATFDKFRPDVVVHLAAQPSLLASIQMPEQDASVNILGTINVLKACESYGVEKFIFSSTSAVTSSYTVPESSLGGMQAPDSPYGMSKRTAESYIRLLRHKIDRRSFIIRLGNVYGPRQMPLGDNQLVPRLIRHFMFGDPFEVYGNGEQTRDFIYAQDVADLIYRMLDQRKRIATQVINGATGKQHSVLQVCQAVASEFGSTDPLPFGEARDQRDRVEMKVHPNWWKWESKTSLKDGIKKTVAWWKDTHGDQSTHTG